MFIIIFFIQKSAKIALKDLKTIFNNNLQQNTKKRKQKKKRRKNHAAIANFRFLQLYIFIKQQMFIL